jgi:hypothetical protein
MVSDNKRTQAKTVESLRAESADTLTPEAVEYPTIPDKIPPGSKTVGLLAAHIFVQ